MSIYFCVSCQNYRDADVHGINNGIDGQYCDNCWDIKEENEKVKIQVDSNSIEILEIDKRVKKLEGKNEN